ncbi:MAG: hypothetical protein ACP5XB_01885 [Isosphaeraceae bacterium]
MTRIVIDLEVREKLHNLTETLELCDEAGRVLATLTPTVGARACLESEPQIAPDELLRRKQSKGKTLTTAEVLAHLESL